MNNASKRIEDKRDGERERTGNNKGRVNCKKKRSETEYRSKREVKERERVESGEYESKRGSRRKG